MWTTVGPREIAFHSRPWDRALPRSSHRRSGIRSRDGSRDWGGVHIRPRPRPSDRSPSGPALVPRSILRRDRSAHLLGHRPGGPAELEARVQAFGLRHAQKRERRGAAGAAVHPPQFQSFGFTDVTTSTSTSGVTTSSRCTRGSRPDEDLRDRGPLRFVHLRRSTAPGADDDASGTFGVLEVARVLSGSSSSRRSSTSPFPARRRASSEARAWAACSGARSSTSAGW